MFIARRPADKSDFSRMAQLDTKASEILAKNGRRSLLTGGSDRERQSLASNGGFYFWTGNQGWSTSLSSAKEYKTSAAVKARLNSTGQLTESIEIVAV